LFESELQRFFVTLKYVFLRTTSIGTNMRAGLIIGGLFLMFVGILLFFTIIFTLFAILCGFVGFVMLIVGLFTSSNHRDRYYPPPQVTTTVYSPPPQQYAPTQPLPSQGGVKYCTACGTPTSKDNVYCGKCGKKFLE
jgi:hypothetical protein